MELVVIAALPGIGGVGSVALDWWPLLHCQRIGDYGCVALDWWLWLNCLAIGGYGCITWNWVSKSAFHRNW